MGDKTKNTDAAGVKSYHDEVAKVSDGIIAFFKKTFSEVRFEGPPFDPAEVQRSPVMFVGTHRSHADYFFIGSNFLKLGFRNIRFAAGDNLTKLPWIGPRFLTFGAFAVARDGGFDRNYVRKLCDQVIKMLKDGDSILVFPEGGRSYSGSMLEIKGGILNAALMLQAQTPGRDVFLVPAAISYDCLPDLPHFPLLLKGKTLRKRPNGLFKRTLGSIYYFGADVMAFLPFLFARYFGRKYGALYMDYGMPVSVRSIVDLEANRVQNARDEFAAHRASLDIVGGHIGKLFTALYRIQPIHIISAGIKSGKVDPSELEPFVEEMKASLSKDGRNCKTIGALSPQEIIAKGIAQLRKLKAVKIKNKKISVRKSYIIDYFAATVL
ncbi:glycerol-3-phosphate acyltransferase [Fibrobacteres bacterium R8-0-B4]